MAKDEKMVAVRILMTEENREKVRLFYKNGNIKNHAIAINKIIADRVDKKGGYKK